MYNNLKVLDVHGHVSVPLSAMGWLAMILGSNTALPSPLEPTPEGITNPTLSGVTEEEYRSAVERHVSYIDERQIDVQLIGPRPFLMFGWMEAHLIPAATRYVNDMIHQQCSFFPDRFVGACQLPQLAHAPDTTHCLDELERCVGDLGFGATYVSPDPEGRRTSPGMHEPYWYPLYAKCQELDIPIIVHGSNCLDPRLSVVPHNYQLGFVVEQYLATQLLSHSDVFDRFPDLRVLVCHCGGALDRWIATDPHVSQKNLARNLFFDTCAHDIDFLSAAIRQRTPQRMAFGTEAPGSGGTRRPDTGRTVDDLVPVIDSLGFLTSDEKIAIFNTTPGLIVPALAKA